MQPRDLCLPRELTPQTCLQAEQSHQRALCAEAQLAHIHVQLLHRGGTGYPHDLNQTGPQGQPSGVASGTGRGNVTMDVEPRPGPSDPLALDLWCQGLTPMRPHQTFLSEQAHFGASAIGDRDLGGSKEKAAAHLREAKSDSEPDCAEGLILCS